MTKTRIWAPILIATVLIGGLLLVTAIESVDAKPDKRVFGFGGTTAGGVGGNPDSEIWIAGDGDWTKGTDKIKAKGVFRTDDGKEGKWKATTLSTPGCCASTSANVVAFTADFKTNDGDKFTWKVVVGTGDINNGAGTETFWVQNFGFGNAVSLFFNK